MDEIITLAGAVQDAADKLNSRAQRVNPFPQFDEKPKKGDGDDGEMELEFTYKNDDYDLEL